MLLPSRDPNINQPTIGLHSISWKRSEIERMCKEIKVRPEVGGGEIKDEQVNYIYDILKGMEEKGKQKKDEKKKELEDFIKENEIYLEALRLMDSKDFLTVENLPLLNALVRLCRMAAYSGPQVDG